MSKKPANPSGGAAPHESALDALRLELTARGVVVSLRVQPKASRDALVGMYGAALKVTVTAPPDKGKANEAVVRLLADALDLSVACVVLVSGESSRDKRVLLAGLASAGEARSLLAAALEMKGRG